MEIEKMTSMVQLPEDFLFIYLFSKNICAMLGDSTSDTKAES